MGNPICRVLAASRRPQADGDTKGAVREKRSRPRLELDNVGNDRSIGIQRGLIDGRGKVYFPNMIGWDGTSPRNLPALS